MQISHGSSYGRDRPINRTAEQQPLVLSMGTGWQTTFIRWGDRREREEWRGFPLWLNAKMLFPNVMRSPQHAQAEWPRGAVAANTMLVGCDFAGCEAAELRVGTQHHFFLLLFIHSVVGMLVYSQSVGLLRVKMLRAGCNITVKLMESILHLCCTYIFL